jgi:hypothetical protein
VRVRKKVPIRNELVVQLMRSKGIRGNIDRGGARVAPETETEI